MQAESWDRTLGDARYDARVLLQRTHAIIRLCVILPNRAVILKDSGEKLKDVRKHKCPSIYMVGTLLVLEVGLWKNEELKEDGHGGFNNQRASHTQIWKNG